ncbi:MAG: hypothetical protein AAGF11_45240 [Myxococcota bacterium]
MARHKREIQATSGWMLALTLVLAGPIGCRDRGGEVQPQGGTTDPSDPEGGSPGTCEGVSCSEDEVCVQGRCVMPSDRGGCVRSGADDSCGPSHVCAEVAGKDQCIEAEPCDGAGGCAPGQLGAVCNVGLVDDKDQVCLLGLCRQDSDCPDPSVCATLGEQPGRCSSGEFGAPCVDATQCISGSCFVPSPDRVGLCS